MVAKCYVVLSAGDFFLLIPVSCTARGGDRFGSRCFVLELLKTSLISGFPGPTVAQLLHTVLCRPFLLNVMVLVKVGNILKGRKAFSRNLKRRSCSRSGAAFSCSGRKSMNKIWLGWSVNVARTDLSNSVFPRFSTLGYQVCLCPKRCELSRNAVTKKWGSDGVNMSGGTGNGKSVVMRPDGGKDKTKANNVATAERCICAFLAYITGCRNWLQWYAVMSCIDRVERPTSYWALITFWNVVWKNCYHHVYYPLESRNGCNGFKNNLCSFRSADLLVFHTGQTSGQQRRMGHMFQLFSWWQLVLVSSGIAGLWKACTECWNYSLVVDKGWSWPRL